MVVVRRTIMFRMVMVMHRGLSMQLGAVVLVLGRAFDVPVSMPVCVDMLMGMDVRVRVRVVQVAMPVPVFVLMIVFVLMAVFVLVFLAVLVSLIGFAVGRHTILRSEK